IFNMGLEMILPVSTEHVEKVQELLPQAFEIGRLVPRKTKAAIFKEAL
ncbi:phosphoribosylformylglycinamidine cyclo-ligase, partial [Enterococcus faecalis]